MRTPAPGARTAVRSVPASGAMRRMLCASRNDDYSVASVHGRPSACPIALLPLLFAVLDLLVLLDQAKSTRKESVRKNFPINFSGIIPSQCLGDFLRGANLHLLSPKGGAKSVRRAKKSGNGRRLAPKTLRGQARARVFDGASFVRSSSRFFAMRRQLCASRNDDYLLVSCF